MNDILVIGDSCRDIFIYCDTHKLCPDVPVPILNVRDHKENPGMAKNVQRNIQSLGLNCDIITNENWYDVTKTRYVHTKSNHMFFRVDSSENISKIDLKQINYDYKLIVISDYNKGFLNSSDIETICSNHKNVFIDTKKQLGSWISNAKYIKINDNEYKSSIMNIDDYIKNKVIHTMGGDGCQYNGKIYPVDKVEVQDVSGAGDTFLAALISRLVDNINIYEAITFAQECCNKVIQRRGTCVYEKDMD